MALVFQTAHVRGFDVTRFVNMHATRPYFARLGNNQTRGQQTEIQLRLQHIFEHVAPALPHTVQITCHRVACTNQGTNKETLLPLFPPMNGGDFRDRRIYGTLCVSRENVTGGVYAFRPIHGDIIYRELVPGELYVFPPSKVHFGYRTALSIYPDHFQEGFLDLIYFEGMIAPQSPQKNYKM